MVILCILNQSIDPGLSQITQVARPDSLVDWHIATQPSPTGVSRQEHKQKTASFPHLLNVHLTSRVKPSLLLQFPHFL